MTAVNKRFRKRRDIDREVRELLADPEMLATRLLFLESNINTYEAIKRSVVPALDIFYSYFRLYGENDLADSAEECMMKMESL